MKEIKIPKVINDYNHWMGGVDKANQLISNFWPNLRYRRVWLPIMFYAINVLQINTYIVH